MRIKLIAVATCSLAVATPALANDFVVQYKDLDLSNTKDRQVLERRIDAASRDYCGANRITTGSRIRGGAEKCVASARELAREQLASIIERQTQKGG
jgi:UrcA family protein